MKAYVINLNHRTDRWISVLDQSHLIPLVIERFEASTAEIQESTEPLFVPAPVLACFDSHKKLLAQFLKTGDNYALILEDDFLINRKIERESLIALTRLNFDFLQIGFLTTTIFQLFSIKNKNFFDTIFKVGSRLVDCKIPGAIKRFLSSKTLISEQSGIPWKIVLHDIRPGTHAYLVSRKLASAIQSMNSPTFLSADGLYIALGPNRNFKMGRLRKSLVNQSDSPSSIL